jgi:hypothetical protein
MNLIYSRREWRELPRRQKIEAWIVGIAGALVMLALIWFTGWYELGGR